MSSVKPGITTRIDYNVSTGQKWEASLRISGTTNEGTMVLLAFLHMQIGIFAEGRRYWSNEGTCDLADDITINDRVVRNDPSWGTSQFMTAKSVEFSKLDPNLYTSWFRTPGQGTSIMRIHKKSVQAFRGNDMTVTVHIIKALLNGTLFSDTAQMSVNTNTLRTDIAEELGILSGKQGVAEGIYTPLVYGKR